MIRSPQILLATAASVLTVRLSASPSFVSYKDSGVLAPEFGTPKEAIPEFQSKRPIMYFVGPLSRYAFTLAEMPIS